MSTHRPSDVLRWHRPLMGFATEMLLLSVVALAGYVVDDRTLAGVPIWAKPLKFSISFAVYAVTLAWLVSRLRRPWPRRVARAAGTVLAVASTGEMSAIVLQVVRGQQSHFNVATRFDSAVFALMGALVGIIFVATVVAGVAFLRESPAHDRATTWAVRLGLAVSVAGMSVGFLMTLPRSYQGSGSPTRGAHGVGVRDGGPVLPLLGWDTTGGDLRVAHFVGLHALQALPLLALALTALPLTARAGDVVRTRLVLVGAGGYAGVFALTLWQALRGQAVVAPDRWTLLAGAALLLAVTVATALVLRRPTSRPRPARVSVGAHPPG